MRMRKSVDSCLFFSYNNSYRSYNSDNMCCTSQSCRGSFPAKLLIACWIIAGTVFCMDRSVSAEEPSLPLIPQSIRWLKGPAHPALGNVGDLNLPEGFRFVDGQGARTILESMKSAVPEGFVGLISPNSGEWALTLAYTQSGHAQDTD